MPGSITRRLSLLPVAVAALLAPASASAQDFFGVNAQFLTSLLPQSSWQGQIDTMAAGGIRVVRTDATWNTIEPSAPVNGQHSYRWGLYDTFVSDLARDGLRWYPVVDYSASWAATTSGNLKTPPKDPADYADFAAALASRYGRGGSFWSDHPDLPAEPIESYEIWNEQNGGYFWQPSSDPAGYANLYAAARDAIHSVDPDASVVIGGLVPSGAGPFVSSMLSARPDLNGNIDAIAYHPYASTPPESRTTSPVSVPHSMGWA